jgi:hypothetical protein
MADLFSNPTWYLTLIRLATMASTLFNLTTRQVTKTISYAVKSLSTDAYVFFEHSTVPVKLSDYSKSVPGSAKIHYYFDRDQMTLYETGSDDQLFRMNFFQSVQLYHGDICLHDLSDFFTSLRWRVCENSTAAPELILWMGVWSLLNGIYLDRTTEFTIRFTDLSDEETSINLWATAENDSDNEEFEKWAEITRIQTRMTRTLLQNPTTEVQAPPSMVPLFPDEELDGVLDEGNGSPIVPQPGELLLQEDQMDMEEL